VLSPESEDVSGKLKPPHVVWHSHVHVEGQSESTVHGGVCSATHVFWVIERQVLPASQMAGTPGGSKGGMGTALQGMVVLVW
jgi:hypothetical protein